MGPNASSYEESLLNKAADEKSKFSVVARYVNRRSTSRFGGRATNCEGPSIVLRNRHASESNSRGSNGRIVVGRRHLASLWGQTGKSNLIRPLTDPSNAEVFGLIDGWKSTGARIAYYDYWRMFPLHPPGFFAPFSNVSTIPKDIALFRELGIEDLSVEVEDYMTGGIDPHPHNEDLQNFNPLKAWLGMKLLDDPDRPVEPLAGFLHAGH